MIYLLRFLLFVFYKIRCHGRKHVPKTGSVLFVSNHQSNIDPAIIGVLVSDRPFKGIAKEALFTSRWLSAFMKGFGVISINRDESDIAAIRKAITELSAGRCV